MIAVSKSAGATVANGALTFIAQYREGNFSGMLVDVFAVSVEVLDQDGNDVLSKTALDVTAPVFDSNGNQTQAPGVNRLGLGRYAAVWATPTCNVGRYTLRWFYTWDSTSSEKTFDLECEVVAKPYPTGPHYCSVPDLREEGLLSTGTTGIPDVVVQRQIVRASRYVEMFTGRTFDPVYKPLVVDGTSSRAVMLREPIVALESVNIVDALGGLILIDDTMKVYNRHLTQDLLNPDDRENPKIEFIHGDDLGGVNYTLEQPRYYLRDLLFPRGRQNVQINGVFGYTEPDGSFSGGTPALIKEATKLLVFSMSDKMINRTGPAPRGAIIQEGTKDQSVSYSAPFVKGEFTGDWDIDSLLTAFVRPPIFGAA